MYILISLVINYSSMDRKYSHCELFYSTESLKKNTKQLFEENYDIINLVDSRDIFEKTYGYENKYLYTINKLFICKKLSKNQ